MDHVDSGLEGGSHTLYYPVRRPDVAALIPNPFTQNSGHPQLKAPQAGVIKDLATHTSGTVVQPGTVLASMVPLDERLKVEIWVSNEGMTGKNEIDTAVCDGAPYPA